MAATIGALRVVLGADTAQFEKGLRGAQGQLTALSRTAKVTGVAIGLALTAAIGAGIKLAAGIRQAINEADKMGKMAQSIGVPIEALSKLRFAADLSGVSIDELGTGITKLNRMLVDASRDGASRAAQAFRALGIDIAGIKGPEDALLKIATAFKSFEDGAGKSAVAAELFGRSLGQKMIPLLNQGEAGIKNLYVEAEALGLVFTGEMAKAAEQFNDDLRRLQLSSGGLAIRLANDLLPVLQKIVDVFVYLSKTTPGQAFDDLMRSLSNVQSLPALSFEGMREELGLLSSPETKGRVDALAASLAAQAEATKSAAAATRDAARADVERQSAIAAARTPLEEYIATVEELRRVLDESGKDAETFSRLHTMAAASAVQPWLQVASTIGGALGQLFEDNKGVAIAQAIINTAQGITAALAQYPPPLSFAMAAAQAAAGAAQIATIKSTRPGSGGSVRKPSAGGGSGKAVTQASQTTQQQRAVYIKLEGSGRYSREEVLSIIDGLIEAQKDGAQLVLARQ